MCLEVNRREAVKKKKKETPEPGAALFCYTSSCMCSEFFFAAML